MTEVSRISAQNAEVYRQMEVKKVDKRHEELRKEDDDDVRNHGE